ncbi:amidohydrolase [Microbacterium sp. 69-10]|uniref:amidohydrolase n=1 Tax=Microbacterium sp. 69-10 TaxID=1895783 RepID=UPI0025ECD680|nr:amidohydrolase [Microbacterium sp. 69-10]
MRDRTLPSPFSSALVRRAIHAQPELGFTEIITADLIWRTLEDLGWSLTRPFEELGEAAGRLLDPAELEDAARRAHAAGVPQASVERFSGGCTGFIAELHGGRPGPVTGLRVDLDALPVRESTAQDHIPTRDGFASRHPGIMHACGHDGHIAIALRVAAGLAAQPDFPGTVRLILQPAEEGVRGALPMAEAGACDGLDSLIAYHLGFGAPVGTAGVAEGLMATTKYRVHFAGRAAHAGRAPEQGRHALLAAAEATVRVHGLIGTADTGTRVNVGALRADGASNIVPALATLLAEVRGGDAAALARLDRDVRRILADVSAAHDVGVRIDETGRAETTRNAPELVAAFADSVPSAGLDFAGAISFGASDDASILMNKVSAAGGHAMYALFGTCAPAPHHASDFDIDDAALDPAAMALESLIRSGSWYDKAPSFTGGFHL